MNNIKHKLLTLCVVLLAGTTLFGQQVSDLRINELLIKNDSNYVDEYGRHVPWVEIFNTAYNSVNIAGCFLTDDTTGLAAGDYSNWYRIPSTDPTTLIPQRSMLVFYLDDAPLYGTYHTNFDPNTSKNHYIALISSNGKTLIDIFHYPANLANVPQSFGCIDDGISTIVDENGKTVSNMAILDYFTPGSTNKVHVGATKSEHLQKSDPHGIGLAVISISVVFAALIMIFIMLKLFGLVSTRKDRKASQAQAATGATADTTQATAAKDGPTGEEIAAIAMALHCFMNSQHDEESEVITIDMPSKHYSPWSQKSLVMKKVTRRR